MNKRVAIVLFNLGGPDAPESVRPFLFNLLLKGGICFENKSFRRLRRWNKTEILSSEYRGSGCLLARGAWRRR